ncbi:hypothetical protein L6E10_11770 [Lentzea sp. CC55]|nr:hypothetical protein [Lentzea sp. CC55]MCG8923098.1 hypothetical protein [Lentzea sp. CC55]
MRDRLTCVANLLTRPGQLDGVRIRCGAYVQAVRGSVQLRGGLREVLGAPAGLAEPVAVELAEVAHRARPGAAGLLQLDREAQDFAGAQRVLRVVGRDGGDRAERLVERVANPGHLVVGRQRDVRDPVQETGPAAHVGVQCEVRDRVEVGGVAAEQLGGAAGAFVWGRRQLRPHAFTPVVGAGDDLGEALAVVGERLLRLGDRLQAQKAVHCLIEVFRLCVENGPQLAVRQERPVGLQRVVPPEVVERLVVLRPLALRGVLARRPASSDRRPARPRGLHEVQFDGGVGLVQVAPALEPHVVPGAGPARVVAGQHQFRGLGEARLARAVAPGHDGQAGTRCQRQACPGADAPEAAHADLRQVDPVTGAVGLLPRGLLPVGHAGEGAVQRSSATARRQHQFCRTWGEIVFGQSPGHQFE